MSESKPRARTERVNQWIGQLIPGATSDNLPHDWSIHVAGSLGLALQHTEGGIVVRSLRDLSLDRELGAAKAAPLFTIGLHSGETEVLVTAEAGWQQTHVHMVRRAHHDHPERVEGRGFVLEWSHPLDERIAPLTV